MFENIMKFFKKINKKEEKIANNSRDTAKERLHLVLMQDRANVSADFLELMKQEIIEVIKKYIDVDESAIDVRLTNKENEDGTNGAPALYANIPILNIKNEARKVEAKEEDNNSERKVKEEPKSSEKLEKEDKENLEKQKKEEKKSNEEPGKEKNIASKKLDKKEKKDKTAKENVINNEEKEKEPKKENQPKKKETKQESKVHNTKEKA